MRILITGGAGFIGSNLAHALSALGAQVTVVDNFHSDYGANAFNLAALDGKPAFRFVRGDIVDQPLAVRAVVSARPAAPSSASGSATTTTGR